MRSAPPRQTGREASGAVLFARFAYPPNALGYCGPADHLNLLGAAAESDLAELGGLAPQFEGAWPYLQLIAAGAGIGDPLDRRVVEAYWLGGPLLDLLPPALLVRSLDERFRARGREDFPAIAATVAAGAVAHHSFHVFAVYPWLGLLRGGLDGPPLAVLDRCRIRAGRVLEVQGDLARVSDHGLAFAGGRLVPGPRRQQLVRWSEAGMGSAPELLPGDRVAMHWDWVCARLSPSAAGRLAQVTRRNLAAVNSLPAPGPAVACERVG